MKYQAFSLACSALALSVATPALSQTVVYQSVADDSASNANGSWCADCYYSQAEFQDQFTLGSAAHITGVNLWIYASGGFDTAVIASGYTFNIYNSDRSEVLYSQLVLPITTFATRQGTWSIEKQVGGSLSGYDLDAGTYWAGFEAPMMGIMSFVGGNGTGQAGGTSVKGNAGYQLLASVQRQGAVSEQGAVPEPASWAMMIGGFGLVGATMRRRRTAVTFA